MPGVLATMLRLRSIFAFFVVAALAGCAKTEPTPASATPAPGRILRVAQRNEPASLDPASVTLPDEFGTMRTLLEGLLSPGIDGAPPRPGAAALYNVSIDGRTYTFLLRPDAMWSDGVPVSSAHFLASYRRMLAPETAAPKASVFFPIKNARAFATGQLKDFGAVGIKAPDARTLVLTLERPNARFPYYVASGPYLPVRSDVIAKHGRKWTLPENYVGNGPFTLAEWRADQRIVVRKNPAWHDADHVQLDAIHFVRFDSGDSEERAYRSGQIHVTMSVPFSKVATHTAERPAELQRASLIDPRYLSFNTERPPLNDPRVRRALALALDRNKLVERVLQGGQIAAGRIVPPSLRETDDNTPLPAAHRYDPATARALLAEAGVTPENFPKLELSFWSGPAVPEALQAMWKTELGLTIVLAQREARVHLSSLATGNYDIGFINAIPDVADATNILADFTTGANDNFPRWSSPAYDAAMLRNDPITAESLLLESAPLTPVYFNSKIFLMSPRVHGWHEDGLWSPDFPAVSLTP